MCPHPWCRYSHKALSGLIAITLVATLATDALGYLAVLVVTAPIVIALSRTRFFLGLFSGRLAHQTSGGDGEVRFDIDKRWARVAVGGDVVLLALSINALVRMALHPGKVKIEHSGASTLLWNLLEALVTAAIIFYAHYRATRPRPRRRMRVRIRRLVPAGS